MNSVILQQACRILLPIQLFLAVYFFLRGHNQPGGGFIAALMTVCAFTLYLMAFDTKAAKRLLRVDPLVLMILGWLSAILSGIASFYHGLPFMTGLWGSSLYLPVIGSITFSTVLFFDLGVYLLVCGAILKILFLVQEEK